MFLEKVDAQKRTFTLKFADTDVVSVEFAADKYGYNKMGIRVFKKDAENNPIDKFEIFYSWNPENEETPAFVMDMMSLLNRMGKMKASEEETTEEVAEETEDTEDTEEVETGEVDAETEEEEVEEE